MDGHNLAPFLRRGGGGGGGGGVVSQQTINSQNGQGELDCSIKQSIAMVGERC